MHKTHIHTLHVVIIGLVATTVCSWEHKLHVLMAAGMKYAFSYTYNKDIGKTYRELIWTFESGGALAPSLLMPMHVYICFKYVF